MKNKTFSFILLFSVMILAGCSKVGETYSQGQYETPVFENNYYTGRHDFEKASLSQSKNIVIGPDHYFNGDAAEDLGAWAANPVFNGDAVARKGLRSMYPEVLNYAKKNSQGESETVVLSTSSVDDWRYVDEGLDERYVGTSFGRTKCLITTDAAFKPGFLSKIYNGQMFCDGDHLKALLELDQNGYDAFFPKTLSSGDYFLVSLRGGSTYAEENKSISRFVSLDVCLKFYRQKANGFAFDSVVAKEVLLRTDWGGEGVSFFGFKFSDIGISDVSGIVGMSLSFDNFSDPIVGPARETFDASVQKDFYWGALVYEVMFPDSTWR